MDENEENFLPATQIVDDRVLKDVIAYVEVRCGFENRSKGVAKQLEILGAKVSTRLTKEVTHVIWKDGKPSTHERALKWGKHVVSVLWVDSCRENQEQVAESLFQVKTGDIGSPIIGRLKRLKSMQPKQIEDQVKKSAEKFAKRQKKKAEIMANEAGFMQRPYVFGCHPQSPYSSPRLTPSLADDTPNSMRCALEALDRAKKLGTHEILESPVHGERSIPLHKRLFSLTTSSEDVSDIGRSSPEKSILARAQVCQRVGSSSDNDKVIEIESGKRSFKKQSATSSKRRKTLDTSVGVKMAMGTRRSSRRSLVMKEPVAQFFDEESPAEIEHMSKSARNSSPVFSRKSAYDVFEFSSENTTPKNKPKKAHSAKRLEGAPISLRGVVSSSSINAGKQEGSEEPKMQIHTDETTRKRKRSVTTTKLNQGKKVMEKVGTVNATSGSNSSENENIKKRKKRRLLAVNNFGTPPVHLLEPSKSSTSDSADSGSEQLQKNKGKAKKKRKLLEKQKNTNNTSVIPVQGLRSSLEEFSFKRRHKHNKSKKTENPTWVSSSSESITSSEENEEERKEVAIEMKKVIVRKSSNEKPKRTLCMTSLSQSDQGIVISIISKLGQFEIADTVCDSTTHVILGRHRRTLNVLSAIARGCWLLSTEWIFKSLEEGAWLPEEPFEQHEIFPAAQLSRLEHCASEGTYKRDLFSSFSPVFIGDDTIAPTDRIQELFEWCGGSVCSSARVARLGIGKTQTRTNLKTVDEKWVFDCISELRMCPLTDYTVSSS
ncbi:microcephalin-like [Anneissia japonica]|uniref:microcephalin-like n=1 Tax=Anneissia japonica TaxID=1529436 RepID=UPI001425A32A|nr:microcephalin-like [Anneissia japonica]